MKNYVVLYTFMVFFALITSFVTSAQEGSSLPSYAVRTLEGIEIQTSEFSNNGQPYVISFWATWCNPCMKELNALDEIYDDFTSQGFKVIAISTDDARTRANVLPMVNGKGWPFEFYYDENGDFRRAMGVNNVPHNFIISSDGEIVHQHTAFYDGMQWEILEKLENLATE